MALRRQRSARIFQERKNVLEMFGDEHLIKRLHFLSHSKWEKNIYINKEHHNWLQSSASIICDLHCMMNKSLTPYLHCTRLRRVTAPQPPELISCAVASFWSGSLRCITKDRHLVYFWWIIIIIVSLSSKASATGDIFDYRPYIILSSIGTLNWVVMKLCFLAIMYYIENSLLSNVCWM